MNRADDIVWEAGVESALKESRRASERFISHHAVHGKLILHLVSAPVLSQISC